MVNLTVAGLFGESVSFAPETAVIYDNSIEEDEESVEVKSVEILKTDQNDDPWTLICNSALVTYTGRQYEFMTVSSDS